MMTTRALSWIVMGGLVAWQGAARAATAGPLAPAPVCSGGYADDLGLLSARAKELEHQAATYSFAVRTSAVYECLSYGDGGAVKRTHVNALAYGTAFGYRRDGGDTLLLTNEHVAEWPAVTDADHPVEGVPAGCKRASDALAIVDDDHDNYTPDDVPLERVVVDPALDIAVLRAHAALGVIPWRVGASGDVTTRTAVLVKGFPLGEFRATNVGKVISTHSHDEQGDWDHEDFVVDALLTSGGSGSPVLAVSCKTGELELVGIFHARYVAASALNVVIAIDQVKPVMATLQPTKRPEPPALDAAARTRLVDEVRRAGAPAFFALGQHVASVEATPAGALRYALYAADFPRTPAPVLVVDDLPPAGDDAASFGHLGDVRTSAAGAAVDAGTSEPELERALALFRRDALATFDYRAATQVKATSRATFDQTARQGRALDKLLAKQHDQADELVEVASRLEPPAPAAAAPHSSVASAGR